VPPVLAIAVVDMYATSRVGWRRGWARTLPARGILTQAYVVDVVDVVDMVNISAASDAKRPLSLTSLTPKFGVNIRTVL
jgi:hypothetical protein